MADGWKSLAGTLIQGGATMLGNALMPGVGGAAGAKVGGMIAGALGVEATPAAVSQALNADPESWAKLRQLELTHGHELRMAMLEAMKAEEAQVSTRHQSDMQSDSALSKAVRPLTLIALVVGALLFIALDSAMEGFTVRQEWIGALFGMLETVMWFYFGGRTLEKATKMATGQGLLAGLRRE